MLVKREKKVRGRGRRKDSWGIIIDESDALGMQSMIKTERKVVAQCKRRREVEGKERGTRNNGENKTEHWKRTQ